MFKKVKLESQRELLLKTGHPKSYQRFTFLKQKPIYDKITNITFTNGNSCESKNTDISSRQKYLNNILKNSLKPYNDKKTFPKLSKIRRSRNIQNKTFDKMNSSEYESKNTHNFRCFSNNSKSKTEYKVKDTQSCYSYRTYNKEVILRKTNNSRIRKLYSMTSDIFNIDESSSNIIENSSFYNSRNYNYNNNYTESSIENIFLGKEKNHNNNYQYFTKEDKYGFDDKLNNTLTKDLFINGRSINSNKIKNYNKNVQNKTYKKLSLLSNKDFSNSDFVPFLHKIKSITKTNESNIESVNYDIISNKSNNLYDKYNKLSNKKVVNSQYENYEIIIPKDYNRIDGSKLKNLLHAEGIHFFNFREDANVSGNKGKFKFKIRNSNIDKNNNEVNNIGKLSKKIKKLFNIKLKKCEEFNEKKTTEITKRYGPEVVRNHLQTRETINKLLTR